MRLTEVAQTWLAETLEEGDIAVDATLGNGFDALFLAKQVGETGHVYGFDVQQDAIHTSQKRLQNMACKHQCFLAGHETMKQHIPSHHHGKIKAIMFNLGWLPNSDKKVITEAKTTLVALKQSLDLLASDGRLTVMLYPGHQGGDDEAKQVTQWLLQQKKVYTQTVEIINKPHAPKLLQVIKIKNEP